MTAHRRTALPTALLLAVALGGAASLSWSAPVAAQDPAPDGPAPDGAAAGGVPPEVVQATVASVGLVRSAGGVGSGWVVGAGSVVTNFHVARAGTGDILVDFSDGVRQECWTAAADRDLDLAVLKCDTGGRRPVALAPAEPAAGTPVAVVGYPWGEGPTVTTGEATGERARPRGIPTFRFTAAIAPGSSGSPVVDAAGRATGVATFGDGWAVPVAGLAPLVDRAEALPVSKSSAEWRLRLRRLALVVPVVTVLAWYLGRRTGREHPVAGALRWAVGGAVATLAATQAQFSLDGPTSFF